jgi:hypothetical protein
VESRSWVRRNRARPRHYVECRRTSVHTSGTIVSLRTPDSSPANHQQMHGTKRGGTRPCNCLTIHSSTVTTNRIQARAQPTTVPAAAAQRLVQERILVHPSHDPTRSPRDSGARPDGARPDPVRSRPRAERFVPELEGLGRLAELRSAPHRDLGEGAGLGVTSSAGQRKDGCSRVPGNRRADERRWAGTTSRTSP